MDKTINHWGITGTNQELGNFISQEGTSKEISSTPYDLKHNLEICGFTIRF